MYARLTAVRAARGGVRACLRPLHSSASRPSQQWFDPEAASEPATRRVTDWPSVKHTTTASDDYVSTEYGGAVLYSRDLGKN